jgi:hypothetical protein
MPVPWLVPSDETEGVTEKPNPGGLTLVFAKVQAEAVGLMGPCGGAPSSL